MLTALSLGKRAVGVVYKVLNCYLTITSVLCYIGDMVMNNMSACKQVRDKLIQDKQSY